MLSNNKTFIFKNLAILVLGVAAVFVAYQKSNFEADLLKSFHVAKDSPWKFISALQKSDLLARKVFIYEKSGSTSESNSTALRQDLKSQGLESLTDIQELEPSSLRLYELAGSYTSMANQESAQEVALRSARSLKTAISTPGIDTSFLMLDPFGFSRRIIPSNESTDKSTSSIWQSKKALTFEESKSLWNLFEKWRSEFHLMSESLFRFVNEDIIRRDVIICTLIGSVVNGILFWFFLRSWSFLLVFLTGSVFSWGVMSLGLSVAFPMVYPAVIGFASSFLSFNAEYLVHLCGVDKERSRTLYKALYSAVGTTLIGLAVLLLSSSELAVQMGAAALFAMFGFFVATLPFLKPLSSIKMLARIDFFKFPQVSFRKFWVPLLFLGIIGNLYFGLPKISSDIKDFRFAPQKLLDEERFFQAQFLKAGSYYSVDKQNLRKIMTPAEYQSLFQTLDLLDSKASPMQYREEIRSQTLNKLKEYGVELSDSAIASYSPTDDLSNKDKQDIKIILLQKFDLISLDKTYDWFAKKMTDVDAQQFQQNSVNLKKLDFKEYFNSFLTYFSMELIKLFAVGIFLMALYLWFMQKSISKVFVIMFPLLFFCIWGGLLMGLASIDINIIHILGLILVIGFSLDYTAIAVSTEFNAVDQQKILLTGLSTLASFAGLAVAKHPFLSNLGWAVVLGIGFSLVFTFSIAKNHERAI